MQSWFGPQVNPAIQQQQQMREDAYRQVIQQATQKADAAEQHVRQANQAIMTAQRNQDAAAVDAALRSKAEAQAELAALKQQMTQQANAVAVRAAQADQLSREAERKLAEAQRINDPVAIKKAAEDVQIKQQEREDTKRRAKESADKAVEIGAKALTATSSAVTNLWKPKTTAPTVSEPEIPQEQDTQPENNPIPTEVPEEPAVLSEPESLKSQLDTKISESGLNTPEDKLTTIVSNLSGGLLEGFDPRTMKLTDVVDAELDGIDKNEFYAKILDVGKDWESSPPAYLTRTTGEVVRLISAMRMERGMV